MSIIGEWWEEKYGKLEREFEQYKKESIKWSLEDIQYRAELKNIILTNEEAQEILEDMIYGHDAELGINWITIDCYLDEYVYNYEKITKR